MLSRAELSHAEVVQDLPERWRSSRTAMPRGQRQVIDRLLRASRLCRRERAVEIEPRQNVVVPRARWRRIGLRAVVVRDDVGVPIEGGDDVVDGPRWWSDDAS